MSWSQPFRKMAGASGSAPQRPSICAPLCLDARTHALCTHTVQAGTSTIDSKIQFQRFMKFEQKLWKSFFSTHLRETLKAILGLIDITIDF